MKFERRRETGRALLGALACVCFLLQQFLVPLHLALFDHTSVFAQPECAHAAAQPAGGHAAPHHSHAGSRADASQGDHEPHPVEEHLEQLVEPAVLATPMPVAVTPTLVAAGLPGVDPPAPGCAAGAERAPRRAPPPRAAAPRAPPRRV
jgi:hypothetical protein